MADGNIVHDVIIAHMITVDTQTNKKKTDKQTWKKYSNSGVYTKHMPSWYIAKC